MPYNKNTYQKAINILQHRRDNALMEQQERTNAAIEKIPQLADIQMKLSRIGYNISTLLFRDENPREKVARLKEQSLALQAEKRKLLRENGFGEDALSIKYTCPACNDSGFVNDRMCNCHRELLKEIERDNLRRFAPIDDCTFDNFNIEYYPAAAMENGVSPREKAQKSLNPAADMRRASFRIPPAFCLWAARGWANPPQPRHCQCGYKQGIFRCLRHGAKHSFRFAKRKLRQG